jgi:hypothetical protein
VNSYPIYGSISLASNPRIPENNLGGSLQDLITTTDDSHLFAEALSPGYGQLARFRICYDLRLLEME